MEEESGGRDPIKWSGRLEAEFNAEVERLGGCHQARPKQLLDALRPQFPELNLQLQSCKWHLQTLRKRALREQEWLQQPGGPVRWTGRLKEAFTAAVEGLGGLQAARPKAVWELLHPSYPMLTLQSCKWHIQTLRKKQGGGGEEEGPAGTGSRTVSGTPAATDSRGAPSRSRPSAKRQLSGGEEEAGVDGPRQGGQQPSRGQQQQQQQQGPRPRPHAQQWQGEEGREQPTSSLLVPRRGAASPPPPPSQQAGEGGEGRGQPPRGASPSSPHLPWGPHLQQAAEAALRRSRGVAQRVAALVGQLETLAAGQAELGRLLEGERAAGRPMDEGCLVALLAQLRLKARGRGSEDPAVANSAAMAAAAAAATEGLLATVGALEGARGGGGAGGGGPPSRRQRDTAVLGALVPLVRERGLPGGAGPGSAAATPAHDPASCAVPGCRRCAYLRRRARLEEGQRGAGPGWATSHAEERGAGGGHPAPPGGQPPPAADQAAGQGRGAEQQQPRPSPAAAQQQQQQQQQQAGSLGFSAAQAQAGPGAASSALGWAAPLSSCSGSGSGSGRSLSSSLPSALAASLHDEGPPCQQLPPPASPLAALGSLLAAAEDGGRPGLSAASLAQLLQPNPAWGGAAAAMAASPPALAVPPPPPAAAATHAPGAVEAAAQQLAAAHPHLGPQLCAAICVALPGGSEAGRHVVASWLLGAGACSPAAVVALLDSAPQLLHMAHEAGRHAGVRLMHWMALLALCKQLL